GSHSIFQCSLGVSSLSGLEHLDGTILCGPVGFVGQSVGCTCDRITVREHTLASPERTARGSPCMKTCDTCIGMLYQFNSSDFTVEDLSPPASAQTLLRRG
ncbi:unnamed protein product, partial [Scytosiphon promiscuus]